MQKNYETLNSKNRGNDRSKNIGKCFRKCIKKKREPYRIDKCKTIRKYFMFCN